MFLEFALPTAAARWKVTLTGSTALPQRGDRRGELLQGADFIPPNLPIGLKIAAPGLSYSAWLAAVGNIETSAGAIPVGTGGGYQGTISVPGGPGTSLYVWLAYTNSDGYSALGIYSVDAVPILEPLKSKPGRKRVLYG